MLTEPEKDRLNNRDTLAQGKRKLNDWTVRRKLKKWLDDIDDVKLIMNNLPDRQLIKIIDNHRISLAFSLVNNMLYLFNPIAESDSVILEITKKKSNRLKKVIPGPVKGIHYLTREATTEELQQRDLLKDFISGLVDRLNDDDAVDVIEDILSSREDQYYLVKKPKEKGKIQGHLELANTYINLGAEAQRQRDLDAARKYYEEALRIFNDHKNEPKQVRINHLLGLAAQKQGDFESSKNYLLKSLEISVAIGDEYEKLVKSNLSKLWKATKNQELSSRVNQELSSRVASILCITKIRAEELLDNSFHE